MDLSKVKNIITPHGSLKRILRGDVVIWSKKSDDLKYTIWKDGVLIDRVTMSQFVNKIHNGDAQTDYGIGAQIYVPYTDPFNGVTYDCPFNFGTFTQYPGKLGLQTHYALPSKKVAFSTGGKNIIWENSYIYYWLNELKSGSLWPSMATAYGTTIGFPSCLPEDFVEAVSEVSAGENEVDCKFFLLSREQSCVSEESYRHAVQLWYWPASSEEGSVWEYWQEKIGTPQTIQSANNNRVTYTITNHALTVQTITLSFMNSGKTTGSPSSRGLYGFKQDGRCGFFALNSSAHYQPACVIG